MAQYREGRVTVTLDSDIVAGTDTAWLSNVATGDIFLNRGDEVPYRVAAVLTDTSLRLAARYAAPTETNVDYSITRDFTEFLGLPIIHIGDVDAVPLFAEALIQLDFKLRGGGGSGGGSISLSGLTDVTTTGAIPGDQFTMLPGGTFGFVHPTPFTITFDHAPGDGGRIFKSYASGTVTARRIKASGGTVTENPDDITINIPAPGEANTLETAGSSQAQSLVAAKSGTILRTKGLRAGTNVTLTPEGNDLVIASTGGGGGAITYTMAPLGTGFSLVGAASGTEFRVKTLILDGHFTASEHASGGLSVVLNPLSVTDISTVQWSNISSGQVLTRNASSQIVGTTLPAPGIASVFADKTPQLGGPLTITGQRIIGQPVSFSMMIARPKAKSYTVVMSCPASVRLESLTGVTAVGSLSFRVDIAAVPDSTPDGIPDSKLQGSVTDTRSTVAATTPIAVDPSQQIIITLSGVSATIEDLAFTISGVTV